MIKTETKETLKQLIPFFFAFVFSIISLLVYLFAMGGRDPYRITQIIPAPIIALIIPIANRIFKINVPFAFNAAVGVYAVIAIDCASVMNFYGLIPYFDKFLHTAFGIIGAMGVFILLLYGSGDKMKSWCFFLIILFVVLGLAAAWEIYEYTAESITGKDIQGWKANLDAVGDMTVREFFKDYNPLWDTLWDMIVAVFGVFIFYAWIFVDKLLGWKMCKSIYTQVHSTGKRSLITENSPETVERLDS